MCIPRRLFAFVPEACVCPTCARGKGWGGRGAPSLTAWSDSARPGLAQVRWTKTAGSASDKFQETSVFNETLRIERIARTQGGRYYCKAENGVGVPAIKSIRVDVQCELRDPFFTPGLGACS